MKRYLLFIFEEYEQQGGAVDFHNDFNTVEECVECGRELQKKCLFGNIEINVLDTVFRKLALEAFYDEFNEKWDFTRYQ